jgi:L-fuculose-phosphate aldolase
MPMSENSVVASAGLPADPGEALLDQLVTSCRVLGAEGQGDMVWGHVSLRDPDGRGFWMKAAGLGLEEITRDDLVLIDREGTVLAGDRPRHSEFPIHTEVMAARPDVGCVVHTHARAPVAFAAVEEPLRPVSHEGTYFVPPDVPRFTETSDLILTPALGAAVAATLGDRPGLLLVGHGLVTAGSDVVEATMAAVLLDRACRVQLDVLQTGRPYRWTPDREARVKRTHVYPRRLLEQGYAYLARQAALRLTSRVNQ